jgi:uncharacterized protein
VTARSIPEPLTWNVTGLLAEPAGSTRDYDVAGVTIDLGDDLRLADPIEGRVHVGRTNRGLLVNADFTTSLQAECSRCLREVEVPLELHVEEEVLPSLDLQTGQPVKIPADDEVVRLTDHHELQLETLVREAILLAQPIAPLCEPDCPGLCTTCGERLTGGPHDHGDEDVDPRLEALKAFKVDAGAENE